MNLVVFSIFLTLFSISNGRSALDKRYRFDYIEEVDDPEIEFINETLRNFNKIRRRYAIDEQVPNVWKLTWSESLVQKIKKLPKDCNALVPKDGYRFFFLHSENTDRKRQKWENDHMGALFRHNYSNFSDLYVDASKKSVLWAELIQRNQKEIGCGKYKCRGWKVLQISWRNHGETNNFDEICLIGPQTEFIWPHKHVNGTPGSVCANEGGKGFNKLCIPESVDLEDYTTPIPVSEVLFEYSSASFGLCELWLIVSLISLVLIK